MSITSPRLEDELASRIASGSTGVVDARDGKKRWLLYFEQGSLVGSKSNLKSERLETLLEQKPGLEESRALVIQAVRRVRNALKAATVWTFKTGAPKERQDVATGVVLVRALAAARPLAELEAAVDTRVSAQPQAADTLAELGLSSGHREWLRRADGTQSREQLIAAAPGKRPDALAALWLASAVGALEAGAPSTNEAKADAESTADATPDPEPAPQSGGLDLSSLIADSMAQVQPDEGEDKEPAEAAFSPDAAPMNPANEMRFEDDIGIEPLTGPGIGAPASHVVALPTFQQRDVAAPKAFEADDLTMEGDVGVKHPLEDKLRESHARVIEAETHFSVFGLEWDAGEDAFRVAHLELARALHPDRYTDGSPQVQELANEAFDRVRAAWEVLGDEEKRGQYIDSVVHGIKTEDELAMEQVETFWKAESEFKRGLAIFNQGRIKQSHEFFAKAHQAVPEELEFRAYYAFTSFKQAFGRDEDAASAAKESLKEVLDKNQEQARKLDAAWVLMGIVYRDLGTESAAKKCFVQALKLNPSNADAPREMRRITGGAPGGSKKAGGKKSESKAPGFFSRLFGGGKKK